MNGVANETWTHSCRFLVELTWVSSRLIGCPIHLALCNIQVGSSQKNFGNHWGCLTHLQSVYSAVPVNWAKLYGRRTRRRFGYRIEREKKLKKKRDQIIGKKKKKKKENNQKEVKERKKVKKFKEWNRNDNRKEKWMNKQKREERWRKIGINKNEKKDEEK